MEKMVINAKFWKGRNVFITGHTGFKGSWAALWLIKLGANVFGYSISKLSKQSLFVTANLQKDIKKNFYEDILDYEKLYQSIKITRPSLIIHMAAQSIVRKSYHYPLGTLSTNILGTANLFEAARRVNSVKAIINVTSDKCYENFDKNREFKEKDILGGSDPYSASKACSEIITSAYRKSFLKKKIHLASVRAGNVIGGGDWAEHRLIPDFFRALYKKSILNIRFPNSVRPWQHVLDPICGYLKLGEKLLGKYGEKYAEAWNFGPNKKDSKKVLWIIKYMSNKFSGCKWKVSKKNNLHESRILKLSNLKSKNKLKWKPNLDIVSSLDKTIEWYDACRKNLDLRTISEKHIDSYSKKLIK